MQQCLQIYSIPVVNIWSHNCITISYNDQQITYAVNHPLLLLQIYENHICHGKTQMPLHVASCDSSTSLFGGK